MPSCRRSSRRRRTTCSSTTRRSPTSRRSSTRCGSTLRTRKRCAAPPAHACESTQRPPSPAARAL
eukprot:909911-Prymnesium_polylepis.1